MKRLAVALSIAATPVAADPCRPHVMLTGDAGAVKVVGAELVRLNVDVIDHPILSSCKTINAEVELARDGFAVAVEHGNGSEGRTVGTAIVAATWIDSWLQDDFGDSVTTEKLATSPIVDPIADQRVAAVYEPPAEHGVSVNAAFDQAWTNDGQRWTGITGGACASFGAWCFGGKARYAVESQLAGQTAARRSDFAVLATGSRTFAVGRLALVPELGLGVGRANTSRIDGCHHVQTCDPDDPHCNVPQTDLDCIERDPEHAYTIALDDHMSATTFTPRAAAALKIAIPLATSWFLEGTASAMVAPFAHTASFKLPMGTPVPFGIPADQLALPGESIGTFELGIGLRWGAAL
ncbi:MAG: hypothetical protein QM831_30975 [Kofleriaceae bacterium]